MNNLERLETYQNLYNTTVDRVRQLQQESKDYNRDNGFYDNSSRSFCFVDYASYENGDGYNGLGRKFKNDLKLSFEEDTSIFNAKDMFIEYLAPAFYAEKFFDNNTFKIGLCLWGYKPNLYGRYSFSLKLLVGTDFPPTLLEYPCGGAEESDLKLALQEGKAEILSIARSKAITDVLAHLSLQHTNPE